MSLFKNVIEFIKGRFSKNCCPAEPTPAKVETEAPKIEIIQPIVKEVTPITIEPIKVQPIVETKVESLPIVEVLPEQPKEVESKHIIENTTVVAPIQEITPVVEVLPEPPQEVIVTPIKVEAQHITVIPVVEDTIIVDKIAESITKTNDITVSTLITEMSQPTPSIEITVDALSEIVTHEDIIINKALAKKQPVKRQPKEPKIKASKPKETTAKKNTKKSNVVVAPVIKEPEPVITKKPTKRKTAK